jgi:hypothetical protein
VSLARRARLARLTARLHKPIWPDPEKRRRMLQHHVEFCLLLRETLPLLGVDLAEVKMLRTQDEATAELAALGHAVPDRANPDSWEAIYLRCAENPTTDPIPGTTQSENSPTQPLQPDDVRTVLSAELERTVQSYLDDPAIDFSNVSLMQVFTWCAARLLERSPASQSEKLKAASTGQFAVDSLY